MKTEHKDAPSHTNWYRCNYISLFATLRISAARHVFFHLLCHGFLR